VSRVISWWSAGAASAVATKLALQQYPNLIIAYCEIEEEHPDNKRFLKDCEKWYGKEITVMGNDKYKRSIYEVFNKTRYIAGVAGARCTKELKKQVRIDFQQPNDIQVFGFTAEEESRLNRFIDANNEVDIITPLIDQGLTKPDCLAMIQNADIELPEMYKLGYKNNNCVGCCKAQSPAYWKKIQIDFPDMFQKMVEAEKMLNVRICKYTKDKKEHRVFLTELPKHIKPMDDTIDAQCGVFCLMAEGVYS